MIYIARRKNRVLPFLPYVLLALALVLMGITRAYAATPADLDRESDAAVHQLTTTNPTAATIASKARAVLIFPNIVKAGLIFGGAYGEGELKTGQTVDSYYNSLTASWGLQAGAQSYGYIVFLMNDDAVKYVKETHGWEIGTGPTLVVVNAGIAKNLTTSTLKNDAYAFIFDQQGLMAALNIEGTKISRIKNP